VPVVRVPAVELPVVNSMPIGVPTRRVLTALRRFAPDVVHLAAPFVVGCRGLLRRAGWGVPSVAVYQTDVAGFASSYGLGLSARRMALDSPAAHDGRPDTRPVDVGGRGVECARGAAGAPVGPRRVDTGRFTPAKRSEEVRATLAVRRRGTRRLRRAARTGEARGAAGGGRWASGHALGRGRGRPE